MHQRASRGCLSGREIVRPSNAADVARFRAQVDRTGACWIWRGRTVAGYGAIQVGGKPVFAHRLAYAIRYGRVPPRVIVRHVCDNPLCVNPTHLRVGSQRENISEARARGRVISELPFGEGHPSSKFSDAEVKHLRDLYASGKFTQQELALRYGVRQSTISLICSKRRRLNSFSAAKSKEQHDRGRPLHPDQLDLLLAALSIGFRELGVDEATRSAIMRHFSSASA
jgi:hypothetical protein